MTEQLRSLVLLAEKRSKLGTMRFNEALWCGIAVCGRGKILQSSLVEKLSGGLKKAFEQNVLPDDSVLVCLGGLSGEALVATQSRVLILKAGYSSGAIFGQKAKSFLYEDISSVEYSCGLTQGRVQITAAGSVETRHGHRQNNVLGALADAWQAENVCNFPAAKKKLFQEAANLVRSRIEQARSAVRQTAATAQLDDIPTQIRKLAELKVAGILSEEEFERKKAELLARM